MKRTLTIAALALASAPAGAGAATTVGLEWEFPVTIGVMVVDESGTGTRKLAPALGPEDYGRETILCSKAKKNGYPLVAFTYDMAWVTKAQRDEMLEHGDDAWGAVVGDGYFVRSARQLEIVTAPIEPQGAEWNQVFELVDGFLASLADCRGTQAYVDPRDSKATDQVCFLSASEIAERMRKAGLEVIDNNTGDTGVCSEADLRAPAGSATNVGVFLHRGAAPDLSQIGTQTNIAVSLSSIGQGRLLGLFPDKSPGGSAYEQAWKIISTKPPFADFGVVPRGFMALLAYSVWVDCKFPNLSPWKPGKKNKYGLYNKSPLGLVLAELRRTDEWERLKKAKGREVNLDLWASQFCAKDVRYGDIFDGDGSSLRDRGVLATWSSMFAKGDPADPTYIPKPINPKSTDTQDIVVVLELRGDHDLNTSATLTRGPDRKLGFVRAAAFQDLVNKLDGH